MSKSLELINKYKPKNEQEEKDIKLINEAERIHGEILTRDNIFGHLTSSVFVVNKERTKLLCVYHNIYKSWSWIGGHADGDDDLLFVAEKELKEETSLSEFKFVTNEPLTIDALTVFGHNRKGEYVSAHLHYNITFLVEADESSYTHIQEEENSGVAWIEFDEFLRLCTEPHMLPVYKKCIERCKTL